MGVPFYFLIECPACQYQIEHGLNVSTVESERTGHMVIPVEMADRIHTRCPGCDARVYTGDLETYAERGEA